MDLTVIDNKGKPAGTLSVSDGLLAVNASQALLHEVVVAHQANQRAGTHSTKTRAEVSGGGIKPWRQKGTGRARAGSIRSPLWRHGGVIFGPTPRDYSQDLPKKKKRIAFAMAFKAALKDGRLQVVDPIAVTEPKTKVVAAVYEKWAAPTNALFVLDRIEPLLQRAARNIPRVRLVDAASLNSYDFLRARKVFVTREALDRLVARVGQSGVEV